MLCLAEIRLCGRYDFMGDNVHVGMMENLKHMRASQESGHMTQWSLRPFHV